MLRSLKTETDTLCCAHWKEWPPREILANPDETSEDLYRSGEIGPVGFQRIQTWEKVCGLLEMAASKCLQCPFVRKLEIKPPRVPVLVSLDGRVRTPLFDENSISSRGTSRSHIMSAFRPKGSPLSNEDADWVRKATKRNRDDQG